ncbi:hypothetical protein QGN29_08955 [Temperatibacter marinus]|uniref:Tetratricopeptide repeat protein n=1 Tax=Temperatibacter marinus TaxID=1456591 RepID=A0AA52H8P9_9PROT|nr:hypothetical protein [Temperatibacter marinus]WND01687.1 hypothetical protein QGN29_08955 [Temperatibacter marinus]
MKYFNKVSGVGRMSYTVKSTVVAALLMTALPALAGSATSANSAVTASQAQAQVPVRGSEQNGFTRLIFDFPVEVPFQVVKTGTTLEVIFEASFQPAFTGAVQSGMTNFTAPSSVGTTTTTTVRFTVNAEAYPRQYRRGTSVYLDIYPVTPAFVRDRTRRMRERLAQGTVRPQVTSPTPAQTSSSRPASTPDTAEARTAATPEESNAATTQGAPATSGATPENRTENQSTSDANVPPVGDEPPSAAAAVKKPDEEIIQKEKPKQDRDLSNLVSTTELKPKDDKKPQDDKKKEALEGPEYTQGESKAVTDGQDMDVQLTVTKKSKGVIFETNDGIAGSGGTLSVDVNSLPDLSGVSFIFNMPGIVPAAAFERYGNLWIVFDGKMNIDDRGMLEAKKILEGRVQGVYPVEHKDATILRMAITANQNIVMEVIEDRWVLQLKDTPTRPRFPLLPQRRNDTLNGNHIFVEANQIGNKLTFEDPTIGDEVVVLPLLGMGRGLSSKRDYAEAILMKTAQGIAIEPLSDKVIINRFRTGVAIKTEVLSKVGEMSAILAQKLVDFDAWRIGSTRDYKKNRARLMLKLSLAERKQRNKYRWDLARFYLAHNRPTESLGLLGLMVEDDPTIERKGDFLAVRGIANYRMGRMAESGADLFKTTLNGEQDIELWRAKIKESRGAFKDTLDHYRRGKDVIGGYVPADRASIQLAVIRAALAEENFRMAQQELDLFQEMKTDNLRERQVTEGKYLRGKLAEAQGRQSEALGYFDEVSSSLDRRLSAYARFSRVMHNLKMKDISDDEAIAELERLSFAWRGPKFEGLVKSKLVELYEQKKHYNMAFDALKYGTIYFRSEATKHRFPERMRNLFKRLFLNGEANSLPASRAVAMFFQYQEHNPKGPDGDRIVINLVDRLEQMDLLDDAANLYLHLITTRVETQSAKASLAADLARVYILDKKPEKSLDIIRATKQMGLPEDIIDKRRWVEAKALIELGRYEEAEVHLEDDGSSMAKELRADLYWGAQDYEQVVTSTRVLLGDSWRRNEMLDSKSRLFLIRSCIAMAFNRDREGLKEMRDRYGLQMRVGDLNTAFELLTNQEDLSGGELNSIVEQIASINKLRTFMRDYNKDFSDKSAQSQ